MKTKKDSPDWYRKYLDCCYKKFRVPLIRDGEISIPIKDIKKPEWVRANLINPGVPLKVLLTRFGTSYSASPAARAALKKAHEIERLILVNGITDKQIEKAKEVSLTTVLSFKEALQELIE